jgi:Spy/CpxP family protein refolding chaperone
MIKLIFLSSLMFFSVGFAHDSTQDSRAQFFKDDLRVSQEQFQKIETIDNYYKIKYQTLNADLNLKQAELSKSIKSRPFNESTVKQKISNESSVSGKIRLNNIKHHLEIEDLLDSFQRMKFNEYFRP